MENKINYTFVIGCPRSGTSILGELISSHPSVKYFFERLAIWEIAGMGEYESHRLTEKHATEPVKKQVREYFENQALGAQFLVEKNPRNSLRIPYVNSIFPEAKFVYIVRDGRDVACSLVPGCGGEKWFHTKPPAWHEYYTKYSGAIRCAYAWRDIVEISLSDLPLVQNILIRYEDLLSSPLEIAEKIFNFIGLEMHEDTIEYCKKISNDTSSSYHAEFQYKWYQNNHSSRIGRWKENLTEEEKKVIDPLLSPLLERLGYEVEYYLDNDQESVLELNGEVKPAKLCVTPNQHARPARIEIDKDYVIFHGYQEYLLTQNLIRVLPVDQNLIKKHGYLQHFFNEHYLKGRSFLDLGANAGFFAFLALQNQAEKATALDIDQEYLYMIIRARDVLGIDNLTVVNRNVYDWEQSSDIVLAMALVHWLYSCTASYGSLDAVIAKLASLANYMLIVEWVDPSDQAIEAFKHTQWNADNIVEPYNYSLFLQALSKYFVKYTLIGDVSDTRKIFVAYKTQNIIDNSCPLPLLYPEETIISCRFLTHDVASGMTYWSRVYSLDGKIIKQATLELAAREAEFLITLSNFPFFPKVMECESSLDAGYSQITLEKIKGRSLQENDSDIVHSVDSFYFFVNSMLDILDALNSAGILHRDIRVENIIVGESGYYLIDFGWAVSNKHSFILPKELSLDKTPPDGSFSNVFQMGVLLNKVNKGHYPEFEMVIARMIDPDSATRIEKIWILRSLFKLAYEEEV